MLDGQGNRFGSVPPHVPVLDEREIPPNTTARAKNRPRFCRYRTVAYNIDRAPGHWIGREAMRRARVVWLVIVLVEAVAAVGVLYAISPGRTIVGGLAIMAAAVLLKLVGDPLVDPAVRAKVGFAAEQSVGSALNGLRAENYVVMHDVEQRGEGNIDHIVTGPTGAYMIETKSRGYQEDALRKARRQAAKLHKELGVWVTPVICVSERDVQLHRREGVWIMGREDIVDWIQRQRNPRPSFERLAVYADSL